MKMTVFPSAAIERSVSNRAVGLLRREHRGRLVHDQHPGIPVERLQDLDALLLADRELPDARTRVDREAVRLAQLGDAPLDRRRVDEEAAALARGGRRARRSRPP